MRKPRKFQIDFHWFIPLFLAIAAVILLIFTLDNRESEARISRSLEQMDELADIQVRLNTNILESRLFYLNHFDGIAFDQQQLLELSRLLVTGVDPTRRAGAAALHELIRRKDERVEAFKTSISVYKNSEQYIGVIISELMQVQGLAAHPEFLVIFQGFHNQLRGLLSRPGPDKRPPLESLLQDVQRNAAALPASGQPILKQILAHARLLIQQAERIDHQVVQIIDRLRVKERTRDLRKATQRAVEADAAKSAILAHMSHKIRTPLNGVIGITGSLLKKDLDPTARDMVLGVSHCGKSLLNLIKDILDFSKIEANKLKLDRVPMNLRAVISEAVAIVSENARQQNVTLIQNISPSVPALVEGDPNRIGQILLNFLSNAIKFARNGRVIVQLESLALSQGHH